MAGPMLTERRQTREIMDDPAVDAETFAAVLGDLAKANRATLAARPTLQFLERAAHGRAHLSVLDVGYGHGDMLRRIARWGERRGMALTLAGIDLDPRSEPIARAASGSEIDFRTGDYAEQGGPFDCVISSLVAHHMSDAELVAFLRWMDANARIGWFVNDLHRHPLSYLGYPLLARLARWHPIVREDGQTSIARAFRPADWRRRLGEAGVAARIERRFPFRLCVSKLR